MKWKIAIHKKLSELNWGMLWIGLALLVLGILAPAFLTVRNFNIYKSIEKALQNWEKIYILLAALQLVLLNTLRAIPRYLGTFFLAEAINDSKGNGWSPVSMLVIFFTIPGSYYMIEYIYEIHYDLGIPAVSMIVAMLIFSKIRFNFVNSIKKVLVMIMMIASVQFLDIMPLLQGLPFGRGESCHDIKQVSTFLQADAFLQGMATICSVLFLIVSLLLFVLILDENNIKRISEEKEQSDRALMENQMRVLENRTYMELNHLVHDLKSPLTSMQTLVGVVKLSAEDRGDMQNAGYLQKTEENIERMSGMISEILYENRTTQTPVRDILKSVLAQISVTEYSEMIRVDNQMPDERVEVNTIRFVRALINLLENAFHAVDKETGIIWLEVSQSTLNNDKAVCFTVKDNGTGIEREVLELVRSHGFSTRGSSGLGLSFVEKVVTTCGGQLEIQSTPGQGTQVNVIVPCSGTETV